MNTQTRAFELNEKFLPLYSELLQNVASFKFEKCTFFPQWGENYPLSKERCGLMVMGRACNGWHSKSLDINILFGTSDESIFNRMDQMRGGWKLLQEVKADTILTDPHFGELRNT